MATDLIINSTSFEIRTALIEYGTLVEFHLERPGEKGKYQKDTKEYLYMTQI